jgi:hypothetical protein
MALFHRPRVSSLQAVRNSYWNTKNEIAREPALRCIDPDFDKGSFPRRRESINPTVRLLHCLFHALW